MAVRPQIADLFCGAGGAGVGLYRAGFDVVGFDIVKQPRYPFAFVQQDALTVDLSGFDAVWASPPCQAFSIASKPHTDRKWPDLLGPTRTHIEDKPYVIENVVGAPLRTTIFLCGLMFGLKVYRHRVFESNCFMMGPLHEPHRDGPARQNNQLSNKGFIIVAGHFTNLPYARRAMGIDWMKRDELAQAVPPAYSEYVGRQLRKAL